MCGARCSGQCCEGFVLSGPGRSLHRDDVDRALKLRKWGRVLVGKADVTGSNVDVFQMVRPVEDDIDENGNEYTRFTCVNFDTETRNCRIYDSRPPMCRLYPEGEGGQACEFEGCTYRKDEGCENCNQAEIA